MIDRLSAVTLGLLGAGLGFLVLGSAVEKDWLLGVGAGLFLFAAVPGLLHQFGIWSLRTALAIALVLSCAVVLYAAVA